MTIDPPRPRVLIVDDTPSTVDLLVRSLARHGYTRLSSAATAVDAGRAVDTCLPDAVLAILDTLEPQPPATDRSPARPLTLDVRALRFVDAASAHHMIAAATRTGGLRIVGASAQLTRLLEFAGASHVPGLVLAPA